MKISKLYAALTAMLSLLMASPAISAEIVGGSGNAAVKLLQDWASAKPGASNFPIKINNTVPSSDIAAVQNGTLDFAIVDTPLTEAELNRLNLQQIPFALNGVSVVVNLPNNMVGAIRLDGPTLGKIFSGEITQWSDPAITQLNPKHELGDKPIIIVHSGETSADYPMLSSYLGNVNARWKAGDGAHRAWPAGARQADGFADRINAIKNTPWSIGYLPMQYLPQRALTTVQLKNRDGNFVSIGDTSILTAANGTNLDGAGNSLSLTNKGGAGSWPISSFVFVVVGKDNLLEDNIAMLLGIIQHGLKFGSIKPTVYNFAALPDTMAKTVQSRIEAQLASNGPAKIAAGKPAVAASPEPVAIKKEERRPRIQEAVSPQEERIRIAKQQADEQAREQAIREARAAKQAAEEAIRAAQAAKLEAEKLAEKNRQIARMEQEKAAREQAEKDRIAKEKADKERAIQQRNQKDEDPLEAYNRTLK